MKQQVIEDETSVFDYMMLWDNHSSLSRGMKKYLWRGGMRSLSKEVASGSAHSPTYILH